MKSKKQIIQEMEKDYLDRTNRRYKSNGGLNRAMRKEYKITRDKIRKELYDITEKIEKSGKEVTYQEMQKYDRLRKLDYAVTEELRKLGGKEKSMLTRHLTNEYRDDFLGTTYRLAKNTSLQIQWHMISSKSIKAVLDYPWSGETFSQRIWDNKTKLVKTLRQEMTRGFIEGKSVGQIAGSISDKMEVGYKEAERLARTERMRIGYVADKEAYKGSGTEKVQYLATEDERTCPECSPNHYKVFELGKEPSLPLHPNCRCTYMAVVPDLNLEDNMKSTTTVSENARKFDEEEWKKVVQENRRRNNKR